MAENLTPTTDQAQNAATPELPLKARFARYNSPFLQLMLPLLTTRYVWVAFEDINPLNLMGKPRPELKPDFVPWKQPTAAGFMRRNFAALSIGAMTLGAISIYSKRTYDDMKTLYAEAIGYELGKKPEDVTWHDMLVKSKNAAVAVTRDAYLKRTLARLATGSSFLVPWHKLRDFPHADPKYDANVSAGIGAVGVFLSLDGFLRKPSFFDAEQSMVDIAINHTETNVQDIVQPKNIQLLLYLQRHHLDKNYEWPKLSCPEGQNEVKLATRIADLINQTYNNAPRREEANFTIGKFNYLVGFGLLDSFPASLAFVEMANKSKDMKDVNAAAAALHSGQDPQAVFRQYGIELDGATRSAEPATDKTVAFACKVQPHLKHSFPPAPRSLQDFALQAEGPRQLTH